MTRWTVLTIAAVTNVIAVVTLASAPWWRGGCSPATTLALAGTVGIAVASLGILFVVFRARGRQGPRRADPTTTRAAGRTSRRSVPTWSSGTEEIDSALRSRHRRARTTGCNREAGGNDHRWVYSEGASAAVLQG
jgi:hypothetical protein